MSPTDGSKAAKTIEGSRTVITKRRFLSLACCCSVASFVPGGGQLAQSQVVRSLTRILVGFTAGGNTDFVARLLANEMKGYSSAVIVESRPGASGRIALEGLKSSVADGSAMTLTPAAMIALFPHIYKSLRYDPFVDFIPVTMICRFPRLTSQMPIEQIAEAKSARRLKHIWRRHDRSISEDFNRAEDRFRQFGVICEPAQPGRPTGSGRHA